ncbi:LysR substrate-binding domain-containing protein [Robbsia andropogonis]|uniref:LysR substrate-binding domain-containing protein n=1 Tax=Robbsia andropogonis TaxID=28092 RepID=UPI000467D99C|nr:LysR substrate-binding domain-containing protein [Robbsia andropogonis]
MAKLNAKQMDVFAAVMTYGSITAAAQQLNVSQPAVSRMIERFEMEAGFVAFERRRGRLIPTPESEIFFAEVRQFYRGIDYLNDVAREIGSTRRGYLRIGVFPAFAEGWITQRVAQYLENKAQIFTSVMPMSTDSVVDAVSRQTIDLGITLRASDRDGVRAEEIWRADIVCIVPSGHRLSRRKIIEPADLSGEDFVAMADRGPTRNYLDTVFNSLGIERKMRAESPWASTVCHMVAERLGVALVLRDVAEEFAFLGFHVLSFQPHMEYQAFLVSGTTRPLSAAAKGFREILLAQHKQNRPKRSRRA